MKCEEFKNTLYLLSSGDLSDGEAEKLNLHLENCSACRQELMEWEETLNLLKQLRSIEIRDYRRNESLKNILQTVNPRKGYIPKVSRSRTPFQRRIMLPQLLNIAATILIGIFVYQQITINKSLTRLQQQVQQMPALGPSTAGHPGQPGFLRQLNFTSDTVNLDAPLPSEIAREIELLKNRNHSLLRFLEKKYPGIYEDFIQTEMQGPRKEVEL